MKKLYLHCSDWMLLPLATIILIAASTAAYSQTAPAVSVSSRPSGATVILSGDYTVTGITPTSFSQGLQGLYRITAHHEGFETYHSTVVLSGRDAVALDFKLIPKTRLRAAIRSLVIPGWGQRYVDSRTKGAVLTLGAVAALATAGAMHLKYENRRDDFDDYNALFHATRSVEEREKMLAQLYTYQKKAYDAENNRNIALGVVGAIWAYNLLDAILFFPDYGLSVSGASLGFQPDHDLQGAKVVGTVRF